MTNNRKLPDFIYQGKDIPEILRLYEAELRKSSHFQDLAHATAIQVYHDMITDRAFLTVLRHEFDCLYEILEQDLPDLRFSIEGRRKSLISSENKINKLLNENKSMDQFRDMFAFRIILFGNLAEKELVKTCYSVMNSIITYYVHAGYTLCDENPVCETMSTDSPLYNSLVIPDKSEINNEYIYGVKDYIMHPKDNGYQSLHCVFRTKSGYCFEVQVRTLGMDILAAEGSAEHSVYKKAKYKYQVELDRNQVHIPGYYVSSDGTVHDLIGLEEPLCIFHRKKTF